MAFSPESRYTRKSDFTEKYTLEMTSQVIQKRDSFAFLLQLYRFVCRSSWALEVHAVLSGFVCIKKYSCCRLWFSGQKSEYQLRDHLWWSYPMMITYDGRDYCWLYGKRGEPVISLTATNHRTIRSRNLGGGRSLLLTRAPCRCPIMQ